MGNSIKFNKQTELIEYFNTSNSNISSNNIMSITYHNDAVIVSTDSNLLRFNNGSFDVINDTIRVLLIENFDGNLVVADSRGNIKESIYILEDDSIAFSYNFDDGIFFPGISYIDITIDDSGNVWFLKEVFYNHDIIKFDGVNIEVFNSWNTIIPSDLFGTSISSSGNNIYVSNLSGLYKYDGAWELMFQTKLADSYEIINGVDTLKSVIVDVASEPNQNLWCSSNYGQVAYFITTIGYLCLKQHRNLLT